MAVSLIGLFLALQTIICCQEVNAAEAPIVPSYPHVEEPPMPPVPGINHGVQIPGLGDDRFCFMQYSVNQKVPLSVILENGFPPESMAIIYAAANEHYLTIYTPDGIEHGWVHFKINPTNQEITIVAGNFPHPSTQKALIKGMLDQYLQYIKTACMRVNMNYGIKEAALSQHMVCWPSYEAKYGVKGKIDPTPRSNYFKPCNTFKKLGYYPTSHMQNQKTFTFTLDGKCFGGRDPGTGFITWNNCPPTGKYPNMKPGSGSVGAACDPFIVMLSMQQDPNFHEDGDTLCDLALPVVACSPGSNPANNATMGGFNWFFDNIDGLFCGVRRKLHGIPYYDIFQRRCRVGGCRSCAPINNSYNSGYDPYDVLIQYQCDGRT